MLEPTVHQMPGDSTLARYAREFAEKAARHKEEYSRTNASALIFRLGQELYALPTATLREVYKAPRIHSIPERRDGPVLGLANYRGELLFCVSLKCLLGIEPTTNSTPTPALMLVLGWHGLLTGCPVDAVQGPYRFLQESLRPGSQRATTPGLVLGLLDFGEGVASVLSADAISAVRGDNHQQT